MKILIITIGTQGDARPFVALGQRLKGELGHQVVVATSDKHRDLVEGGGLEHATLRSDFAELMAKEHAAMENGNQLKVGRQMAKELEKWVPIWVHQGLEAAQDAELIIGSGSGSVLAASLAEKLSIPFAQVQFMPLTPSTQLPPLWPNWALKTRLPGWLNVSLGHTVRFLMWRLQAGPANVMRKEMGLDAIPMTGPWSMPMMKTNRRLLYSFSSHLLPQPSDWPSDQIKITGSWFYEQANDWQPPEALSNFLEEGPTPIYVGFGSMLAGDPKKFAARMLDAIRQSGERAVVATGWGAMDPEVFAEADDPNILCIEGAPHDWLFPRMKLCVHHGGSGTCAATARAGVPQVIVPFVADQFFWGYQLHQIGLAPEFLDRGKMTAEDACAAIKEALSPDYQARAKRTGELMTHEDGIGRAIEYLKEWKLIPEAASHTHDASAAEEPASSEQASVNQPNG